MKYQNNFASSYLFVKNLPTLIEKNIQITKLLNSEIFRYDFDYDEWPGTHTNEDEVIRPYNESIFNIRQHYTTVFPEPDFEEATNEDGSMKDQSIDSSKIYKIKYSINLLPQIGAHIMTETIGENTQTKRLVNQDIAFMGIIAKMEELDVFNTEAMQNLIDFKWDSYGMRSHLVGCMVHLA